MEASLKVIKSKKCRVCGDPFTPARALQAVCTLSCAVGMAQAKRINDEGKALKVERKVTKTALLALKPHRKWLKEAKSSIQQSRRLEELAKGRGCMSCGRTQTQVEGADGWKPGGAWDGGHFIGKGANATLALEPKNIWLQCKSCNSGSYFHAKKGQTVAVGYEAGLVEAEGQALVDWLKGPHEPRHYDIEALKAIKVECNAKSKALKLA